MAKAKAFASGTIVNALATNYGSAFALDLVTNVKLRFENDLKENIVYEDGKKVKNQIVDRLLTAIKKKAIVEIESKIPRQSGLGSSSAFMNALILAIFKELNEELNAHTILTMNARISLEMGISYTGAFDDASASLLGGIVVTNNSKMKILKWDKKSAKALVLIPTWQRNDVLIDEIKKDVEFVKKAIKEALDGKYRDAMLHNSLHYCSALKYPLEPLNVALNYDVAAGLSGNGSCYVAFGNVNGLYKAWKEFGEVVKTRIVNESAEKLTIPDYLFAK
ncbi:MAG: shikimate kinase [Archaeoglobaceae archaeon]|nr:shikimate kinase [Archaeoglobaceae archaeon]